MMGSARVGLCVVGLVALGLLDLAPAGEQPTTQPPDTCVLQVHLPPGAELEVDGQPYGDRRRLTWDGLEPGRLYACRLKAKLPDGTSLERQLAYRGGWHIDLSLLPPDLAAVSMELQFGTPSSNVSLSPDGRQLLYTWGREAVLQDVTSGRHLRRFAGHSGSVSAVTMSPDGRLLATGGEAKDRTVTLWDALAAKPLRSLWGHTGGIAAMAFSPDGSRLLTGSSDNTAILWDLSTGEQLQLLRGHRSTVNSLAYSADGRRVVTGSYDNTAIIWDPASGKLLHTLQGHKGSIRAVAITPDARHVLTIAWEYYVKALDGSRSELWLWDAGTGRLLRKLYDGPGAMASVAVSTDSRQALTALRYDWTTKKPGRITVWDLASGRAARELTTPDLTAIWAFWSPDGKQIITTPKDGAVLVLDAETGKELHRVGGQSVGGYYQLSLSRDGRQMVLPGGAGLMVWDPLTGKLLKQLGDESLYYNLPTLSPDGRQVLSVPNSRRGGEHPKPLVWLDIASGQTLRSEPACGEKESVRTVAVSGDGRFVLTCTGDKTATLWDYASGRKRHTLNLDAYGGSVALSPDGSQAAVGLLNGLKVWDTASGNLLYECKLDDWCEPVVFSPDGARIAVALGSYNKPGNLVLCDAQNGRMLQRIDEAHFDKITKLAFSRDGKYLLSSSYDDTAALWDVADGRNLSENRHSQPGRPGEAESSSRPRIGSQRLQHFRGHTADVHLAAFLPDERYVITASSDMTFRYWDVATGDELARMYRSHKNSDWLAITPEGLFDGTEAYRRLVAFRLGEGPGAETVPSLVRRFHYPDLMEALLRPQRPRVPAAEKVTPAPLVRIVGPSADQPLSEQQATVEVEVIDQGGGVRGPTLWHNLNELPPPSAKSETTQGTQRQQFHVTLVPGENRFEARAATADGAWPSSPAVTVIRYEPPGMKPAQLATAPPEEKPEILLQSGHAGPVTAVVWSADNKLLLTASEDRTAILWEVATGRQLRTLQGHAGEVHSVAFSPDGRLALTGGEDSRAILWNLTTGRRKGSFPSEYFRVAAVGFTPDAREVLLAGGNTASLYDAATGRLLRSFRQSGDVRAAALSPDGKLLATAGGEYQKTPQLILWDAASGAKLRSLAGHAEYVKTVAFSRDGRLLASADNGRVAIVWDTKTGVKLGDFVAKEGDYSHDRDIGAVAFSPDGRQLLLGQEGGATVWDVDSGKPLNALQSLSGSVTALAFSPDGRRVLLASHYRDHGAAFLYDAASGQLQQILRGHTGGIHVAAFSPTGKHIATGGDYKDKTAILWNAETGELLHRLVGHAHDIHALTFTSDGSRLLTVCDSERVVHLWDVASGNKLRTLPSSGAGLLTPAISPDCRLVLTPPESYDDTAQVWDAASGAKLRTLQGRTEDGWAAAFTADNRRVLTGGGSFQGPADLVVWDAASGHKLQSLRVQAEQIKQIALSGDGRQALTCSRDGNAVLWDLAAGQPRYTLDSGVESIAVSPDGRMAVTRGGYRNRQTSVWEMESAKCLRTFTGEINAVAFSPDSRQLLAGLSGSGMLWDIATGTAVSSFRGLEGETKTVIVSSDGRQVLTGGGRSAQAAMIWDRQSGQPLKSFRGRVKKVHCVGTARAGRLLWTAGSQYGQFSEVVLWDPETGQPSRVLPMGDTRIEVAGIAADGRSLFTWDGSYSVNLWRLPSGIQLHSFDIDKSYLDSACISVDGRRVVAVGRREKEDNRRIVVWDAESGSQLREINLQFTEYVQSYLSPDGRIVLSHPRHVTPCTATLWESQTGSKLRELGPFADSIQHAVFSPDGQRLFLAFSARGQLYDVDSGQLLRELTMSSTGFAAPAFSPDARRLATHGGSSDTRIFVWDTESGEMLHMLRGHKLGVQSLAFLPDGRLLSGAADGSARIWDLQEGRELVSLISLDDGRDWLIITPEGLFDGSLGGRQAVSWRVPGQEQPVAVDRFFNDFYRAGLLASVVRGEQIEVETKLGKSLPPRLAILSPASGTIDSAVARVEVQATDRGGGISNLSIFQNGARVLAAGASRQEGKTLHRTFEVPLVEGRNQIRVTAGSQDGSWEADPAEVVLLYEKPLAKSRLYVVTVGINSYADANLNLQFAAKDAQAVAELFRRRGQRLYERVQITPLTDQDATRDGIKRAVKQVAAETRLQDTLVLFLAGHGTMVGQRYYFVPHELRKQAERLEDDIRKQGLPADELSDYLVAAKALKRLLILDTCASGGALAGALKARSGFALREAIERLSRTQGVFTIAASAATEEAQEAKALGHGVLTYSLLAGLKAVDSGPLADRHVQPTSPDQVVDVLEWFTFAAGQVPRLTQKLYGVSQDVQTSTQGASFPVLPLEE